MTSGTANSEKVAVIFDTNILISALLYGGTPKLAVQEALRRKTPIVTSNFLLAELSRVLSQKFNLRQAEIEKLMTEAMGRLVVVSPTSSLRVVSDEADNRVLEAALAGGCRYLITGDKELLALGSYEGIVIVTPRLLLGKLKK